MSPDLFDYFAHTIRIGAVVPCGWLKPSVVRGYFSTDAAGELQRTFFHVLLQLGFRRTYWQLVFPGQTAGIIKQQTGSNLGPNEYHVRFYDDGVIDCELEYDRFHIHHWTGKRVSGIPFLELCLDNYVDGLNQAVKSEIRALFGIKGHSKLISGSRS